MISATTATTEVDQGSKAIKPRRPVSTSLAQRLRQMKVSNDSPANSPLENLPPEIRLHILSMLRLEGLRNLVHASPVYHEQYLINRKWILLGYLKTALGSAALDAYAVYRTGLDGFFKKRDLEEVEKFIGKYKHRRSMPRYSNLSEFCSLREIVGMAAFHRSIIEPIARHYESWVLDNLAKETNTSQSHTALSQTEETRLMRALYRFQLCSNLFGASPYDTVQNPLAQMGLGASAEFVVPIFIQIFEPWEVEEIACFYAFAEEKYDQIFREIRADVHKTIPKVDGKRSPPPPEGTFDLDDKYMRDRLLRGTISRGLTLLNTVFFNIKDHAHLVSTMRANTLPRYDFFDDALDGLQLSTPLSANDKYKRRGEPMLFQGDRVHDPEGEYPPLAWVLLWNEKYHSIHCCWIDTEFRRWGYVLWDAARLKGTSAEKALLECDAYSPLEIRDDDDDDDDGNNGDTW